MSLRLLSFAVIVANLFSVLQVTQAQSSTARCDASFSWMSNSRGQNPCVVAAYLQGVCSGGAFTVNPLPADSHYTGPTLEQANPCQCSTVTYSLVSACAVCQLRTIETWSIWSFNCTPPYIQEFLGNIPSGTSVPAWAYLDVVASDLFNYTIAQADAASGAPESSASVSTPTAFTSNSAVYTSSAFGSSPTTPSPGSGNVAPAKKSNVGVIAGGAVGGVVVLGLIAGLVAFFVVRKRNAAKSISSPPNEYGRDVYGGVPLHSPPMSQQHDFYGNPNRTGNNPTYNDNAAYSDNPAYAERTALRVYDPSDPSTYPQSPPTPTIHTTNSGPPIAHPYGPHATGQPGHYSGIPEL